MPADLTLAQSTEYRSISQPSENSPRTVRQLQPLTSLRFFAALMIVATHVRSNFHFTEPFVGKLVLDQGVSFFFILSGFILTFVYWDIKGRDSLATFWTARVARIFPAYLVSLLAFCLLNPTSKYIQTFSGVPVNKALVVISQLTMTHAWIPFIPYYFSFNSVSWSVSDEFFFYLWFPILLCGFNKKWVGPLLGLVPLVVLIVASGLASLPTIADSLSLHGLIYINPLSRIFEFCIGMLLCIAIHHSLQTDAKPINFGIATVLEICVVSLACLAICKTPEAVGVASKLLGSNNQLNMPICFWLVYSGITLVPLCMLIGIFSFQSGAISRILSGRGFIFLGEISYSLYLLHTIVLTVFRRNNWCTNAWELALYLAAIIWVSSLSYLVVEKPGRRLINKVSSKLLSKARTNPTLGSV